MTAGSPGDPPSVHLLVPIKPLHLAKSRLLGAADGGVGGASAHADLVAAVALDTVAAAQRTPGVGGVVVVTSDPELSASCAAEGIEVLPDTPAAGLNAALRHGDEQLRLREPVRRTGALQADLPALRPDELGAALRHAGDDRAFCPDRHGTGTTLLLAAPHRPLNPRFGPDSAAAHVRTGARCLAGPWESLRCDVDTEQDLELATRMGLGPRTSARLALAARGESM